MWRPGLILCLCLSAFSAVADSSDNEQSVIPTLRGPYLGQNPPGLRPQLFAPEIIPYDGIRHCFPAFSPDGRAVCWMQIDLSGERPRGDIWYMIETSDGWTRPAIAQFSGEFNDHAPVFSADGQRLYFSSSRPGGPSTGKNLWYVEMSDRGFGEPVLAPAPPNSEIGLSQVSFTGSGDVFFAARMDSVTWRSGIYRSAFRDNRYHAPEALGPQINTVAGDVYPFVALDESYLLFGSSRPGARSTETDLYLSLRLDDGRWGEPIQLDSTVNDGRTVSFSCVTHDRKYLFFNRFDGDGVDKFYWVDAKILDEYLSRPRDKSAP